MLEHDHFADAQWRDFPAHLRHQMRAYVNEHRMPGKFLTACLCDKLSLALRYGSDHYSFRSLRAVQGFIEVYVPKQAWGSPEKVAQWEARGFEEEARDEVRTQPPMIEIRKHHYFPRRLPAILAPLAFAISGAVGCTCCGLPWDHAGGHPGGHSHHHAEVRTVL